MLQGVNFRNIKEDDIPKIVAIENETFSDAWTTQNLCETYHQEQAFISVAEADGELVGYCIIYYVLDEGEMVRIAIDQKFRHQGIGQALLNYTGEVCQEKGVCKILLEVRESNVEARRFYVNYGFKEDGIRKKFYDNPKEDAVLMSKEIGSIDNVSHWESKGNKDIIET